MQSVPVDQRRVRNLSDGCEIALHKAGSVGQHDCAAKRELALSVAPFGCLTQLIPMYRSSGEIPALMLCQYKLLIKSLTAITMLTLFKGSVPLIFFRLISVMTPKPLPN